MKKSLKSLLFILALIVSVTPSAHVFAKDGDRSENERQEVSSRDSGEQEDSIDSENENEQENDNDGDDDIKGEDSDNDNDGKIEDQNDDSGKDEVKNITGTEHKSVVAKFVEGLDKVADSDKKIGEQVREIAKQQHVLDESVADAIDKVKSRSKVKTLFLGSDYKNIGKIRSELANTEQRITKLQTLAEQAATPEVKDALTQQVETLQTEQQKVDDFVTTHEKAFSFFGWFVKLFSK